jgi:hypothetical protein
MLDDNDARIVAQRPVDLPVTDVERDDACGAPLEEHVREAARGRAAVERLTPFHGEVEGVEGVRPLHAAAADIRVIGRDQSEVGGSIDLCAGFRFGLPVDKDLSRENERSRTLSRWRESPFNDQLIQSNAQFLQP